MREVVEGEPQAVELGQATQFFRQGAEVVSIQRQCLQATRRRGQNVMFCFLLLQRVVEISACVHLLLESVSAEQHPALTS